jgi:hypothetical protein
VALFLTGTSVVDAYLSPVLRANAEAHFALMALEA